MRTGFVALICLLIALGPVVADEKPEPLAPEQAAVSVLEAVRTKKDGTLRALAERSHPDPWLVADQLCRRGEHDAAVAFAKAALSYSIAVRSRLYLM